MTFYRIDGSDVPKPDPIFRYFDDARGKMLVRSRYSDLCCPACGKIDEMVALGRGVDEAVTVKNRRDLAHSFEWLYVLSNKARDVIGALSGADLQHWPVPNAPFSVCIPSRRFPPVEGSNAYQFLGKCPTCRRDREVIWGPSAVVPPSDLVLGAYLLETPLGMVASWVGSSEVVCAIKSSKLTGFDIRPWNR